MKKGHKLSTSKSQNKKSVNTNKLSTWIFAIGIILLIVLFILIFFSYGFFDKPGEEQLFKIRDECSLVMGNVLHPIKDSGDCLVKCRNYCEIKEMDYGRVEFATQNNSCNVCDCYCNS